MQYKHIRRNPLWMMTCDRVFLEATSDSSVVASDVHSPHPTGPADAVAHSGDLVLELSSLRSWSRDKAVISASNAMAMMHVDLDAKFGKRSSRSLAYTKAREKNVSNARRNKTKLSQSRNTGAVMPSAGSSSDGLVARQVQNNLCCGDESDNDHGDAASVCCKQNLSLLAEVLASECTLFEIQSELDSRISNLELVKMSKAVHVEHSSQSICMDPQELQNSNGYTDVENRMKEAREEVKESSFCNNSSNLHCISRGAARREAEQDPKHALQISLQSLFATTPLSDPEQEKDVHVCLEALSLSKTADGSEKLKKDSGMASLASDSSKYSVDEKCRDSSEFKSAGKELDLKVMESLDFEGIASQKGDVQYACGTESQQTLAEEMYCKEAIRRLIQEMQVEIEQWSQMQVLLQSLQEELNGLGETKSLWEERAHRAERKVFCLQRKLREWRYQAENAQEELVILRCERQILKNRIEMMEEAQMSMSVSTGHMDEVERMRHANVGMQHEQLAASESFVHSRIGSSRSSVDLGISSRRSFRKSSKKFASLMENKENLSSESFEIVERRPLAHSTDHTEMSSGRKADSDNTTQLKNPLSLAHFVNVNNTNLQSFDHLHGQERKKARIFAAFKDKSMRTHGARNASLNSEGGKGSLIEGHRNRMRPSRIDHLWASKSKSTLPSAPTSTPSRILFGNIVNIPKH
ncbi:hypothetical protein KP509_10G038800 [Ceratopteris richardii]|uniref:Uncharacterized protein n=1 Tax=Ceratopteris richardii TaxID=49495 RepID=A0A8T2TV35_CERRI|nr:hypothetical protein KP509_10G038800 [Ceratopteris richardii]